MHYHNYIYLICGLLLVSCHDEQPVISSGKVIPVVFTAAGASTTGNMTRAADDSWSTGDQVGIYMVPHNTDSDAAADFTRYTDSLNVQYHTVSAGIDVSLSPLGAPILFPTDGTDQVSFVAYYPYKQNLHIAETPHIYPVNVIAQNPLSSIDLLYHKGITAYSRISENVRLTFAHQLSKIIINTVPADDVEVNLTTDAVVSLIGFPTEATFDLSTGILGIDEDNLGNPSTVDNPIVPVEISTNEVQENTDEEPSEEELPVVNSLYCEAILIPHEAEGYIRTINVTVEDKSYSYTLPSTIDLEAGKAYSYNFTLTGRALILTGATITNWNEEGITNENIGEGFPVGWDADIDWDSPIVFEGESNCYIVPPRGQLLIPISRAKTYHDEYDNSFPVLGAKEEFYAELYWADDVNVLHETDITCIGTGPNGYLFVKPGANSGNAIVAVQKKTVNPDTEEEIFTTLWSWHVWVVDYNPCIDNYINFYSNDNTDYSFTFMDRNLGAVRAALGSGKGTGLFYQWGRKDPFPATGAPGEDVNQDGGGYFTTIPRSGNTGTISYSIANPGTFIVNDGDWLDVNQNNLWGHNDSKTIFDPCPIGWRVPQVLTDEDGDISPWYSFTLINAPWSDAGGRSWNNAALYPATGARKYNTGELSNVGEDGGYWTASPYGHVVGQALNLYFTNVNVLTSNNSYRTNGYSIRCVR